MVFNIKNLTCTRENSLFPIISVQIQLVCQISAILQDHVTLERLSRQVYFSKKLGPCQVTSN